MCPLDSHLSEKKAREETLLWDKKYTDDMTANS